MTTPAVEPDLLEAAAEPAALPDLSRQVLVLRAGGERLGLVVEEIAGVVERGRLSAVPKAPPGVRGIMNHVGAVLTVVSLADLLGLPETSAGTPLVVVVERRDVRLGLLAERIEGVTLTADLALDLTPEPGAARPAPAGAEAAAGLPEAGGAPGDGRPPDVPVGPGPREAEPPGAATGRDRPRSLPFSRGWLEHEGTAVRVLDGGAIVDEVLARFERRDRRA